MHPLFSSWVVRLSLVVLVLGMSEMIPGQPVQHLLGRWFVWIEFALAASSPMYEGELQDAVDNRLAWILRHQADWALGDWHPSIPAGHPATTKASPFHPGRAVLYSLELLDGLPSDRG